MPRNVYGATGLPHAYVAPLVDAPSILTAAFDAGYRFFDTAEIYGPFEDPHLNERVVGEALAWVLAKGAVPIPGSRKPERPRKNLAAADSVLTADEVADIDAALDATAMSDVFGGTKN